MAFAHFSDAIAGIVADTVNGATYGIGGEQHFGQKVTRGFLAAVVLDETATVLFHQLPVMGHELHHQCKRSGTLSPATDISFPHAYARPDSRRLFGRRVG